MTEWPKEDKIQGRKPDKFRGLTFKEFPDWEDAIKPSEDEVRKPTIGMSQTGMLDKHVWKNGMADHLFDWEGIE